MITPLTSSVWIPRLPTRTSLDVSPAPEVEPVIGPVDASVTGRSEAPANGHIHKVQMASANRMAVTDSEPSPRYAEPSGYIAREHLDLLWSAVRARLCATVETPEMSAPADALGGHVASLRWARMQLDVLECVTALDQLQTTVQHQMVKFQQVELDLVGARSALAALRAQSGEHMAMHSDLPR